ncbi:hypothetical protein ACTWQF_24610 [Streptomyces sp. 8N114]|uniref:hypothetical protein n=1 Tax=Streptomyces sp. 8N114 TaxID=3457419 RepID=UPI003FD0269F
MGSPQDKSAGELRDRQVAAIADLWQEQNGDNPRVQADLMLGTQELVVNEINGQANQGEKDAERLLGNE